MNNSGRATNGDAGKAASFDVGGLSEGLNSLFNPKKDRKEDGEREISPSVRRASVAVTSV